MVRKLYRQSKNSTFYSSFISSGQLFYQVKHNYHSVYVTITLYSALDADPAAVGPITTAAL